MEQTIQLHYLQKVRMNEALPVDLLTLSWPWKQIDELLKM
jgi:hypothetical protein